MSELKTNTSNGNGAKAFGGIMAVFAIIGVTLAAIFGVTGPMSERVSQLERMVHAHNMIDWHTRAGETIPSLTENIKALDDKLLVEITALKDLANAVNDGSSDLSDSQHEGLNNKFGIEIESLKKEIESARSVIKTEMLAINSRLHNLESKTNVP